MKKFISTLKKRENIALIFFFILLWVGIVASFYHLSKGRLYNDKYVTDKGVIFPTNYCGTQYNGRSVFFGDVDLLSHLNFLMNGNIWFCHALGNGPGGYREALDISVNKIKNKVYKVTLTPEHSSKLNPRVAVLIIDLNDNTISTENNVYIGRLGLPISSYTECMNAKYAWSDSTNGTCYSPGGRIFNIMK